jgi:acetyl-CoA carboxylase biotin carboxyl carrier protein
VPLDFNELRQLLVTINQTEITELTLKSNDFELTVRKAVGESNQLVTAVEPTLPGVVSSGLTSTTSTSAKSPVAPGTHTQTSTTGDTTIAAAVQLPVTANPPIEQKFVDVTSPMVGTFYRSPAPGEPSFVEVGDRIRPGQTVCIIEAMKLMNEIEAEVSGQVIEILVQNGEPVEFGQPLLRVSPN